MMTLAVNVAVILPVSSHEVVMHALRCHHIDLFIVRVEAGLIEARK